jgi:hypothetical protein
MDVSGQLDVSKPLSPYSFDKGTYCFHCRPRRYGKLKRVLRRSEIKPRFLSRPAPNMVTVLTELSLFIAMNVVWRKIRKMSIGCFGTYVMFPLHWRKSCY